MKSNSVFEMMECVGKALAEKMPEIIEPLPVCGKTLSRALLAVKQGLDDYNNQKISAGKFEQIKSDFYDAAKEEALKAEPPVFMDCVVFHCKTGCTLPAAKQDMLAKIFEGEQEDEAGGISSFMSEYVNSEASCGDDYYIGDNYVSLNFRDYNDFDYDEAALQRFQQVLNEFAGENIFDYFVVAGHEESNSDMW